MIFKYTKNAKPTTQMIYCYHGECFNVITRLSPKRPRASRSMFPNITQSNFPTLYRVIHRACFPPVVFPSDMCQIYSYLLLNNIIFTYTVNYYPILARCFSVLWRYKLFFFQTRIISFFYYKQLTADDFFFYLLILDPIFKRPIQSNIKLCVLRIMVYIIVMGLKNIGDMTILYNNYIN